MHDIPRPAGLLPVRGLPVGNGKPTYEELLARVAQLEQQQEQQQLASSLERAQEEKASLGQSEERYRRILDNMLEGCAILSRDWTYLYVNEVNAQHAHLTPDQMMGRNMFELIPGVEKSPFFETYRRCMEERTPRQVEAKFTFADGSSAWYEAKAEPVPDGIFVLSQDITERKRSEERLRDSETKLRALFEWAGGAIQIGDLIFDEHGEPVDVLLVDVNPAYERHTGLRREQVVGRRITEILPVVERSWLSRYAEICRTGVSAQFEEYTAGLDKWYQVDASRLAGNRFAAILSDITERKRTAEALQASQALLQAVMANTSDPVYVKDRGSRILLCNPAMEKVAGRPASEIVGRTDGEYYDDAAIGRSLREHDLEVMESGSSSTTEETARTPEGNRVFLSNKAPLRNAAGEIIGIVGISHDITERKRADEALREAEERYRELVRLAPAGIYEVDFRTRRFTSINDAMVDILGYSREELLAMNPFEILDEQGQTRFRERLAAWLAGGMPEPSVEYKVKTKDGHIIDGLLAVSFTKDELGRPLGATVVAHDITERKRVEEALEQSREALREANDRLREADRRKNEFLAVLSHELRNPPAPIVNSLYILERAPAGGEQADRAKQIIGRQVGQLASLVNDLLDVTRITRNKIQLQKERLELCEVVRRTVEDNRSFFDRAEVRLELALALRPIPVLADRTRVAQIVGNLLQNAAKFTRKGGCTRVSVAVEENAAVVRVADDGVGMAGATLAGLFEPFMQADHTLDRSKGGLGLGLALVKGLVELHGGAVSAHSDGLGKGSELVVRLPMETGAPLAPAGARRHAAKARRRVLIIEDNLDAADSLRAALELADHEAVTTHSGPEALAKARVFQPEVVLCDIGLPGMDGFEVARAFRADERLRGVFLVALSGYAQPEDLQRAAEAGFQHHLAKPPSIEKLEQVLAEFDPSSPPRASGDPPSGEATTP